VLAALLRSSDFKTMLRLLLTIALALNVAAIPTSGDIANPIMSAQSQAVSFARDGKCEHCHCNAKKESNEISDYNFKRRRVSGNAPTSPASNAQNAWAAKAAKPALARLAAAMAAAEEEEEEATTRAAAAAAAAATRTATRTATTTATTTAATTATTTERTAETVEEVAESR